MYLLTIIHILVKVHRTVGLELDMLENALVDVQSWFLMEVSTVSTVFTVLLAHLRVDFRAFLTQIFTSK